MKNKRISLIFLVFLLLGAFSLTANAAAGTASGACGVIDEAQGLTGDEVT